MSGRESSSGRANEDLGNDEPSGTAGGRVAEMDRRHPLERGGGCSNQGAAAGQMGFQVTVPDMVLIG